MENTTSVKLVINNPADIIVIVGYFLTVIGVGIWVSWSPNNLVNLTGWEAQGRVDIVALCSSPCLEPIVGRLEVISWRGAP